MNKTVTVNVNRENLNMPCYCSFDGGASFWGNTQWIDSGCEEDLTEKVLETWDGTSAPFTIQCPFCKHEYEFTLTVEIDVIQKHMAL